MQRLSVTMHTHRPAREGRVERIAEKGKSNFISAPVILSVERVFVLLNMQLTTTVVAKHAMQLRGT